jgi:hypothetical protein
LRHLSDVGIWQQMVPAIIEDNLRSLMERPSPLFTVNSGYEKGRDFRRLSSGGRSDAFGEFHDPKTIVEHLNGRLDFERRPGQRARLVLSFSVVRKGPRPARAGSILRGFAFFALQHSLQRLPLGPLPEAEQMGSLSKFEGPKMGTLDIPLTLPWIQDYLHKSMYFVRHVPLLYWKVIGLVVLFMLAALSMRPIIKGIRFLLSLRFKNFKRGPVPYVPPTLRRRALGNLFWITVGGAAAGYVILSGVYERARKLLLNEPEPMSPDTYAEQIGTWMRGVDSMREEAARRATYEKVIAMGQEVLQQTIWQDVAERLERAAAQDSDPYLCTMTRPDIAKLIESRLTEIELRAVDKSRQSKLPHVSDPNLIPDAKEFLSNYKRGYEFLLKRYSLLSALAEIRYYLLIAYTAQGLRWRARQMFEELKGLPHAQVFWRESLPAMKDDRPTTLPIYHIQPVFKLPFPEPYQSEVNEIMRQDPFAHEFYYSFINWGLRMLELANRLGVTKDLPYPISSNLDIQPGATENSSSH